MSHNKPRLPLSPPLFLTSISLLPFRSVYTDNANTSPSFFHPFSLNRRHGGFCWGGIGHTYPCPSLSPPPCPSLSSTLGFTKLGPLDQKPPIFSAVSNKVVSGTNSRFLFSKLPEAADLNHVFSTSKSNGAHFLIFIFLVLLFIYFPHLFDCFLLVPNSDRKTWVSNTQCG